MVANRATRPFDRYDLSAVAGESGQVAGPALVDFAARLRSEILAARQALNFQPEDLTRRGTALENLEW
jgi:hypothetical protein